MAHKIDNSKGFNAFVAQCPMKTDNRNLDKSFEKLKKELFKTVDITMKDRPGKYAHAFGLLESAVKIHLAECTDQTFGDIQKEMENRDDIPPNLYCSHGLGYMGDN